MMSAKSGTTWNVPGSPATSVIIAAALMASRYLAMLISGSPESCASRRALTGCPYANCVRRPRRSAISSNAAALAVSAARSGEKFSGAFTSFVPFLGRSGCSGSQQPSPPAVLRGHPSRRSGPRDHRLGVREAHHARKRHPVGVGVADRLDGVNVGWIEQVDVAWSYIEQQMV